MEAALLTVAAGIGVLFTAAHRRHRRALRRERGAVFDACRDLFDDFVLTQDDIDFPRARGRYRDLVVQLEPVTDDLALRKLPALWLRLSVLGALPLRAVLSCLARPSNLEFWSVTNQLPYSLELPERWPETLLVRCNEAGALPARAVLERHIAVFEDARMKELVVSPRGVRLVRLADEGVRAYYGVFRRQQFAQLPFDRAMVARLLEQAVALYNDLHVQGTGPSG